MIEPDLTFIARKLDQVLIEIANMRDDIIVQTAICQRVDGSIQTLVTEMRAVHRQIARINDRMRKTAAEEEPQRDDIR